MFFRICRFLTALYMCPHSTTYLSSYYYIRRLTLVHTPPHTSIYVAGMFKYLSLPYCSIYVSSFYHTSVLILVYTSPHYYIRRRHVQLSVAPLLLYGLFTDAGCYGAGAVVWCARNMASCYRRVLPLACRLCAHAPPQYEPTGLLLLCYCFTTALLLQPSLCSRASSIWANRSVKALLRRY